MAHLGEIHPRPERPASEQQRLFWVKNPYLRFGDFFSFRAARKEVKGIFARGPGFYWNVWIDK